MKQYNTLGRLRKSFANKLSQQSYQTADYVLAGIVIFLTIFGVVMVYNTSVIIAFKTFKDKYWFFKNQAIWALIGVFFAYLVGNINYKVWKQFSPLLLTINLVLLVFVLIPGFSSEVYGAHQRLVIPGIPFLNSITIQPSELLKLTLTLYLAGLFSFAKEKRLPFPNWDFFKVLGIGLFLTAIEPDLGNAILIAGGAFIIYFTAGANLILTSLIILLGGTAATIFAFISDYRRERITSFISSIINNSPTTYHLTQIFIALGSGGLLGVGLGNSRQKYQYIPEVTTDSIFAVIGEEMGLIGSLIVILGLFFIIWRGYKIASNCQDTFGRLLVIGLTSNIALQTIVNLGGMVGLIPLTGVPLPFISYGGSSLTLLLISIGIIINVSREKHGLLH